MSKKKGYIFFSILLSVSIIWGSIVYAQGLELALNTEKTNIKQGEEVTIQVTANNIKNEREGVNIILTSLKYDRDIFEEIESTDIKVLNNWTGPTYNKQDRTYYNRKI